MGFRRGSRLSRKSKPALIPAEIPQVILPSEQLRQQEQQEVEPFGKTIDDLDWHHEQKARDLHREKVKEAKEQRKSALKQARRAERREQQNRRHSERAAERHPVSLPKDARLALGKRLTDLVLLPKRGRPAVVQPVEEKKQRIVIEIQDREVFTEEQARAIIERHVNH